MVGFENEKEKLNELGVTVFAASVDSLEDASTVQNDVSFPIGHSVSKSQADSLGAWWNEERAFMQPSQFLMKANGDIIQSTYSDGPLGRLLAGDVCGLVGFLRKNA